LRKRCLIIFLLIVLAVPGLAVDKTGLFSVGGRAALWAPLGEFPQAVDTKGRVGLTVGVGFAEAWSILISGSYDFAEQKDDYFDDAFEDAADDFAADFNMLEAHFMLRWNLTPRARFDPFVQFGAGIFSFPVYQMRDDNDDGYAEHLSTNLDENYGPVYSAYVGIGGEFFTEAFLSLEFEIGYDAVFDFPVPRRTTEEEEDLRYYYYEEQLLHLLSFGIGVNLYI